MRVIRVIRAIRISRAIRVSRGFTLVEVLVAVALFVTVAVGIAQLAAVATRSARAARDQTMAVVLAAAKMDQLRALAWTYEPETPGTPPMARSDLTTNVSRPDYPAGGPGLAPSPVGVLSTSTPPYVDYLDAEARWVGNGTDPPRSAVFIRRWAVQPLASDPDRTLILSVLVTTTGLDRARAGPWQRRSGVEAFLVSARTRR
jgi:prepilin-type N-terminal cleavage/methylation domain-containing protein